MSWWKFWKRAQLPANWHWLAAKKLQLPKANTPLSQVSFAVLDVETTGLDPYTDRILSLAVVPVVGQLILTAQYWETTVQQTHFNVQSIPIHEITPSQSAKTGTTETEMLTKLMEKFGSSVWVGHFGSIDMAFLQAAFQRQGLHLKHPMIDTANMLQRADESYSDPTAIAPKKWQLEAVCEHLNLPEPNAHTAAGDALATAFVFAKLLHLLQKRGVNNLKGLV